MKLLKTASACIHGFLIMPSALPLLMLFHLDYSTATETVVETEAPTTPEPGNFE